MLCGSAKTRSVEINTKVVPAGSVRSPEYGLPTQSYRDGTDP